MSSRQEGRSRVCVHQSLRSHCRTCAWTAWCFHPGGENQRAQSYTLSRYMCIWNGLKTHAMKTFWHVSKNSSMVTTPSWFLSIFWKMQHRSHITAYSHQRLKFVELAHAYAQIKYCSVRRRKQKGVFKGELQHFTTWALLTCLFGSGFSQNTGHCWLQFKCLQRQINLCRFNPK